MQKLTPQERNAIEYCCAAFMPLSAHGCKTKENAERAVKKLDDYEAPQAFDRNELRSYGPETQVGKDVALLDRVYGPSFINEVQKQLDQARDLEVIKAKERIIAMHVQKTLDAINTDGQNDLEKIKKIIRDYHYSLDMREHGGVATHRGFNAIMYALDMEWKQGAEFNRRHSK